MSRARVFVLMKPLSRSKSRLASVLGDEQRRLLALALLRRVLAAASGGGEVAVVGGDEPVRGVAAATGVAWLAQPRPGLNLTLRLLMAAYGDRDCVYLPADLPFLEPRDVAELAGLARDGRLAIAPDRHEQGTNALALPAGASFPPLFGHDSFVRHVEQARSQGIEPAVLRRPGLAFDLDTPDDLQLLLKREPQFLECSALSLSHESLARPD